MPSEDLKFGTGSAIILLFRRFPDQKEAIQKLFGENASFRSLCEEYRECIRGLRYWREAKSDLSAARQAEYRELGDEIIQEILAYLKTAE